MRLFEFIEKAKEKFNAGDWVQGEWEKNDLPIFGVYIAPSGKYHHLVATRDESVGKVWVTLYNCRRAKGQAPKDLMEYAKKNPYYGKEPGTKIIMRTNI